MHVIKWTKSRQIKQANREKHQMDKNGTVQKFVGLAIFFLRN